VECIEILKREHQMVRLVIAAARRDLERATAAHAVDPAEAEQLLDFFRYFTNSCHGPKEEDLLFAMLHRRGMAWDDYPLRDLVKEHAEMRVVLDSASDWLKPAESGDPAAVEALLHDLGVYLDLVDSHIDKEEDEVFPLALQRLTAADLEELGDAFTAIACEELDAGVHAYYADLAHHLAGTAA
jgi:branched-chain amino acid transport system ATP-binding protein